MRYSIDSIARYDRGVWDFNAADYLSLIAFVIAIWQIRRVGNQAEAARLAVEGASTRSSIYSILLLASQFEKCDAQLESAVRQSDATQVLEKVREWRKLAAELRGLLNDNHINRDAVQKKLDESLVLAGVAKKKIMSATPDDLVGGTEKLRTAISEATDLIATLAAQIRNDLGPDERRSIENGK